MSGYRLLNTVPGSGLWLVAANPLVKDSLRREAARRGVAAKRLVFSAPTSRPEYLARPRVADLLLDTLPYNAGATQRRVVGRPAGADLQRLDLCRLDGRRSAGDRRAAAADHERLALRLATEPRLLTGLRQKLLWNRSVVPLFDIPRFIRDLESAYTRMWEA